MKSVQARFWKAWHFQTLKKTEIDLRTNLTG